MHAPTFNGLSGLVACTLRGMLGWRWCQAISSHLCLGRHLSLALRLGGCHKLLTLHLLHVPLLRGGLKPGGGIPHDSSLHHRHSFSGQQGALFLQRWSVGRWSGWWWSRGRCWSAWHGCDANRGRGGSSDGDHGDRNGHRRLWRSTAGCERN